jgi:CheY-like chemotaxis protein
VAAPALEVDVAPAPTGGGAAGLCLLVDDEPHLLKLFGTFLARVGFTVVTAADGEQGYQECVARRPAVVVADLNMPRLDGWGMLRRIRTDGRVAETPLVFLSAQDDYRESLKAIGAGAQDYLAKASKMDGLARRIREVLVPRELVQASLAGGEGAHGRAELLGVRWLLEQVGREKATGVVALADGLGVYNVGVREGDVVFAAAKQGDRKLKGEAALEAMLQARTGDLQFVPGAAQPVTNLSGSLAGLVERLAQGLHDREEKAMEQLMVKASGVEIDVGLHGLYERFSGPLARQVAGLLQAGKTPREIIVETQLSPLEVEDTLRDMVRRGVVTLSE